MRRSARDPDVLRLALGVSPPRVGAIGAAAAFFLVACAIASGAVPSAPRHPWGHGVTSLAFLVAAAALTEWLRRRSPLAATLQIDDAGVHRIERGRGTTLVRFDEPLGLTIFATWDRATLRVALTTTRATRYVAIRVRDAEDAAAAPTLIERAITAADGDFADGEWALSGADAERLVRAIVRRCPDALDRAYLSDANGEPLVIARTELRIGGRRVDLAAPLEWCASIFQELGASTVSVFQATWLRQADAEFVLVAPMPGEGVRRTAVSHAIVGGGRAGIVERSVARDVRLMQAPAADPPAREVRRAIERPFMLLVRHALDRAPRAVRPSSAAMRTGGERRRADSGDKLR